MIAYAKRLTASKFVRNVAIVASGTAGAQAITMAFAPFITRLYGPEAFGVLGAFIAILVVLTPVAALCYPIAIVLPKRDVEALGLAKLSLTVGIVMSSIAAFILLLLKSSIVELLNLQAVESFILLLPLAMLFSVAMAVMNQWVIRKKLFILKAKANILYSLWLNVSKVGVGVYYPFVFVLVLIKTLGDAIHVVLLFLGNIKEEGRPNLIKKMVFSSSRPLELALKYRRFAIYRAPQELINSLTQSLPLLVLASIFGPASAGFYALGRTVLMMPTNLIGNAVRDVVYPRMAETSNSGGGVAKVLIKSTVGLFLIGIIPYGFIILFGPFLFGLVFGQEWVVAGEYARWLSVMLLFNFSNMSCISAIPVIGLERQYLLYGVFSGFVRIAGVFIGYYVWGSDVAAIAVFSVLGVIAYLFLLLYVLLESRRFDIKQRGGT